MACGLFPFYFVWKQRSDRIQHYALVRDPLASFELSIALMAHGYSYAESVFNLPPPEQPPPEAVPYPIDPELRARMGPQDLVLMTTRAPLHDDRLNLRKRIARSYTDLEFAIFRLLLRDFEYLDRGRACLACRHRAALAQDVADRGDIQFYLEWTPRYQALNAHDGRGWRKTDPDDHRTAAYLSRGSLWEGGPELLAVFGMAQSETLVWAHRLRTDFAYLLRDRSFVMAEIEPPADVPERPTSLYEARARDWGIDILLEELA